MNIDFIDVRDRLYWHKMSPVTVGQRNVRKMNRFSKAELLKDYQDH